MKNYLMFLLTKTLVFALLFGSLSCSDNENLDPNKADLLKDLPDGFQQPSMVPENIVHLINELREKEPGDYYYLKTGAFTNIADMIPILYDKKLKVVNFVPDNDNNFELIVKEIDEQEEKFTLVEERPSPANGLPELFSFIQGELIYPEEAKDKGIEGIVFVEFVVNEDGTVSSVAIKEGIGAGCDEEAVRVVALSPKWNPGKINNKPVKVKMVLPINFKL